MLLIENIFNFYIKSKNNKIVEKINS